MIGMVYPDCASANCREPLKHCSDQNSLIFAKTINFKTNYDLLVKHIIFAKKHDLK